MYKGKVFNVLVIDGNAEEVLEHWRESGLGARTNFKVSTHLFDDLSLTVQKIVREKPDIIIVGFDLGHVSYNGANVIDMMQSISFPPLVVANDENNANFHDVKMLIDGFAGRDSSKLHEVIRRLIGF